MKTRAYLYYFLIFVFTFTFNISATKIDNPITVIGIINGTPFSLKLPTVEKNETASVDTTNNTQLTKNQRRHELYSRITDKELAKRIVEQEKTNGVSQIP